MHGHNWKVQVALRGPRLDEAGMLYDFTALKKSLRQLLESLDHKVLNEVLPFDSLPPTAENIAFFIGGEIQRGLSSQPGAAIASLSYVKVWETETSSATYVP
jgi:6-pyruvoyltetrahydropterin/6-carboxytetrahydropterin synthase